MAGDAIMSHVGVSVVDLDRVCGFLVHCFNFTITARLFPADQAAISRVIAVPGARVEIACLSGPKISLELIAYHLPEERTWIGGRPSDIGAMHLAFQVDDLDLTMGEAERFGFHALADPVAPEHGARAGRRMVYLRDADGLMVELIERETG
jgi:catechol 2,3-dioxygenase-like lactoylglutathione lyase family enzyme